MKDYSDWEVNYDFENDSPYVDPKRPWLKHSLPTVPKSIKFNPIPVHELIRLSANRFPNNVCVYQKSSDKKFTYRELVHNMDRIASALHELGIGVGDSVGIMSENCPEFIFCLLGILESGASLVPFNPQLKESDISHIVREAGNIKAIFISKGNYRIIKKTRKYVDLENIIIITSEEAKEDTITLTDLIDGVAAKQPDVNIDPENDIAALLFTGGTTGLPKGVMFTHNNLVSAILLANAVSFKSYEEAEASRGKGVSLSVLPLCHAMGFTAVIVFLYRAWTIVSFDFYPSEVLKAIEYYRATLFLGVPVMFQMLINSPEFTERDLSSLETIVSGSAALAPELAHKWEAVVGVKVAQGYGLTETTAISHVSAPWLPEIRSESIGVPIIDTDSKIVNPDTLEELKLGEIGEILIKGPTVMKGYWNNPEATKRDLVDGWLRTGDLGRMDSDGYFYIEGRTKDVIKYKGYKVMPKEVEIKIMEHPAVLEVGVVGVLDPTIGETIKAFIVLKKEFRNGEITEQDIIEWTKEKLARYKYPRKVKFIKSLPRTTIGKPFRKKLREMELQHKSI